MSNDVENFIGAIFAPDEIVSLRSVETWTERCEETGKARTAKKLKAVAWPTASKLVRPDYWTHLLDQGEVQRANHFFGVCPRAGRKHFNLACQIRKVPCLWADLDACTVDEARGRCVLAGLREPSILVDSGNGAHPYWILAKPYLVEDAGGPFPIYRKYDKVLRKTVYFLDEACTQPVDPNVLALSAQAQRVEAILAGIARRLGSDPKVADLARLLRLPGTLNRKDARNGVPPKQCRLVELHATRKYAIEDFGRFTSVSINVDGLVPGPEGVARPGGEVDAFLEKHNIGVEKEGAYKERAYRWVLEQCPFSEGHSDPNNVRGAFIIQGCDGRVHFRCSHKSCKGRRWTDVRRKYGEHVQPVIVVGNKQLRSLKAETLRAIEAANSPPQWYLRAGVITRLRSGDQSEAPAFEPLDENALLDVLGEVADWKKANKDGKLIDTYPPAPLVKILRSNRGWNLPQVSGMIEAPTFTKAGRLVVTPGYDAEAKVWYHPAANLSISPISTTPTAENMDKAKNLVFDDLFADFPFANDASKANALALLLLPFVRSMIDGPTPLHVIDAPTEGTGKSLLAKCCLVVATGREGHAIAECHGDEEWNKTLTSVLVEGASHVFIDNVVYPLNSGTLAKLLTDRYHQARILTRTQMARLPVECVWVATGNNVKASKEITRRMVPIDLDTNMERPDSRIGFRHELPAWAKEHRSDLVASCLTICQAWIAAGQPKVEPASHVGGCEAWGRTMAGILDVAGVPGFMRNRDRLFEEVNTTDSEWRDFVLEWASRWVQGSVSSFELYNLVQERRLLNDFFAECKSGNEEGRIRYLGLHLSKRCRKVYGNWRIEKDRDTHKKSNRYRLVDVSKLSTSATSDEPGSVSSSSPVILSGIVADQEMRDQEFRGTLLRTVQPHDRLEGVFRLEVGSTNGHN